MVGTKRMLAWLCAAAMVLSMTAMPVFANTDVVCVEEAAVRTGRMHCGGETDGVCAEGSDTSEAAASLMTGDTIATVGDTPYTDLQAAVNAAQGMETPVLLTASAALSAPITVTGAVTVTASEGAELVLAAEGTDTVFALTAAGASLTLNNLTVTGVVPITLEQSNQRVLLNNSTIRVVSETGKKSRGILMKNEAVVTDVHIRLNASKILYSGIDDYERETAIGDVRGISLYAAQASALTLENGSEISGFGYSVNLTGIVDETTKTADMRGLTVHITDSTIRGWTTFNIWGSNIQFTITNSTLKGINPSNGTWDDYSVIVVCDDLYGDYDGFHAEQNRFTITNSTVTNHQSGSATESLFRVDNAIGIDTIEMTNVKFIDTTGNVDSVFYNLSMTTAELEAFLEGKVTMTNVTAVGPEETELPILPPTRVAYVLEGGMRYYFPDVSAAAAWLLSGDTLVVMADSAETERIVVSEPCSIVGETADGGKPKIQGAFLIQLKDGETAPVTLRNLEIEHTGVYNKDAALDQKCAVVLKNGSLIAENNYIHIQTPVAEEVSNSPSAMQLSKAASNTAETTYRVSGNTFGYYGQWSTQTNTEAGAVFAAANYRDVYGEIDVDADAIYRENEYEKLDGVGSNFLFCVFDYTTGGYRYCAVGSLSGLKSVLEVQDAQCTIVLDQEIAGAEAAIAAATVNPTTTIFYQDDVSGAQVTSTADNGEIQVSMPDIFFDTAVDTTEEAARYYPVIVSKGTDIKTESTQPTAVYAADISIVKEVDGTVTQVPASNRRITVALPSAWTLKADAVPAVYHVTDAGRDQINGVTASGNLVTFVAPSFSTYEFEVPLVNLSENTAEAATTATLTLDEVAAESDAYTKVYTLSVQSAEAEKVITGLTALSFTANFEKNGTSTTCRIEGANDYTASNSSGGWTLQLSDTSGAMLALKHGEKVVVGKVTFTGYTYDSGDAVNATLTLSNITASYTGSGNVESTLTVTDPAVFSYANRMATQTVTAVISFPNAIQANEAAYQNMTVLIQGSTGQRYEIPLGGALTTDAAGDVCYRITQEVPAGGRYAVTVSGAGYRTAVKSVLMNRDQTVYFWNNFDDVNGANFLAGDILADDVIDLYDLSAVVSYFGMTGLQDGRYVQYDLNRDGKIDARDVAMVLVSWGK